MQKLVASILLIAFLGQSFNQGWYYIEYLVQKREYMKRCVNKAKPEMRCGGKCQLMKKIQAQEERDRGSAPELKLAPKTEVISSRSFFTSQTLEVPPSVKSKCLNYTIGSPVDRSLAFFHPPDILG